MNDSQKEKTTIYLKNDEMQQVTTNNTRDAEVNLTTYELRSIERVHGLTWYLDLANDELQEGEDQGSG